jgi:hypothetical protein
MKKNMGSVDRIVRVLLAIIVSVLYFSGVISGVLGIALLVVAGVLVLTSLVNFCPLYRVFGIKTCAVK